MEKILAGSGRTVALLSLRLGTPVSAALGGKDREDAGTWHAQISSVGQPHVGMALSWGWLEWASAGGLVPEEAAAVSSSGLSVGAAASEAVN